MALGMYWLVSGMPLSFDEDQLLLSEPIHPSICRQCIFQIYNLTDVSEFK